MAVRASTEIAGLRELAEAWNLLPEYVDAFEKTREPSPEALLAVLAELGAPVAGFADIPRALRDRAYAPWRRISEPVVVVWEGESLSLDLRIPSTFADERLTGRFELDDGSEKVWTWTLSHLLALEDAEVEGARFVRKRLAIRRGLPRGYHRLSLELAGRIEEVLVIAAPRHAYRPPAAELQGAWGVFLPLYAIKSRASWAGTGDFGDLETLGEWVSELGGRVIGTLPLMASFLDEPFDPSPYAPASRLFWNELFLHVPSIPEFDGSAEARTLVASAAWKKEDAALRRGNLVDYRRAMRHKRQALECLARDFFARPGERETAYRRFLIERPGVDEYARFRAAVEKHGASWPAWPEAARSGFLSDGDFDEHARRYHLYVQWQAHEQVATLSERTRREGVSLYLDLPLGVHGAGFDVWREQDVFALGLSAGAPPDRLFKEGQNWGFPPLHPEKSRESGYRYHRASLDHLFHHADIVRLDHAMGLHRLYVIPRGFPATDGVYMKHPADELYAMTAIESRRHHTLVAGEDLGTVPPEVRPAMEKHGLRRLYVLQFEFTGDEAAPLAEVPEGTVAALNTHDLPTFAGFWKGKDLDTWRELGFMNEMEFQREFKTRRSLVRALTRAIDRGRDVEAKARPAAETDAVTPREALLHALRHLARSRAGLVLVNLEDLWLETEPQNIPGTGDPHPNWRRRAARSLEDVKGLSEVTDVLVELNALRGGREKDVATSAPAPVKPRRSRPVAPPPAMRPAPSPPAAELVPRAAEIVSPAPPTIRGAVRPDFSLLTADDLFLFNEGSHFRLYEKLGAHRMTVDGVTGVYFAVWAPSAEAVTVIGEFNEWNLESHPLRARGGSGIWEGFIAGVPSGTLYKFHIVSRFEGYRVSKADPFGIRQETPPGTASRVWSLEYEWHDAGWMSGRAARNRVDAPISLYEVHLGSWMRVAEQGNRPLTYRELAPILGQYVKRMGFTHVEIMPVMEHPFAGSWGYQVTGYFAPTSRFGTPQDFMALVDHLHGLGIGVILDWVPSHFPNDEHGLARFDGTWLYEHADPRRGWHPDWDSLIFNYGRNEVRSFLVSNALSWLDRYHADGLRVDAVASMLYLNYSRREGEWVPNQYGGAENLGAIEFLKRLNVEVGASFPDTLIIAEESTSWPLVSRPVYLGGLGFGLKWDMGWMHDMLQYMGFDPIFRKFHHGKLTFRNLYAFSENFMLPLSHDEVVHGKRSLIDKMPGDRAHKFANLRLLLGSEYAQPGKKLLFMGGEFGQWREWDHDGMLSWDLLESPDHRGVQAWVEDLNRRYRDEPALYELDCKPEGFQWVDVSDFEGSVLSFLRKGLDPGEVILVVANYTPILRRNYLVGVPREGYWREILNSDAETYGGTGAGNLGGVASTANPVHGFGTSISLTLPPLSILFLKHDRA